MRPGVWDTAAEAKNKSKKTTDKILFITCSPMHECAAKTAGGPAHQKEAPGYTLPLEVQADLGG